MKWSDVWGRQLVSWSWLVVAAPLAHIHSLFGSLYLECYCSIFMDTYLSCFLYFHIIDNTVIAEVAMKWKMDYLDIP